MPYTPPHHFSLTNHEIRVTNAALPEDLRNIACLIFDEMERRRTGDRVDQTGFEDATNYELRLAFYRTVNEMVRRMY